MSVLLDALKKGEEQKSAAEETAKAAPGGVDAPAPESAGDGGQEGAVAGGAFSLKAAARPVAAEMPSSAEKEKTAEESAAPEAKGARARVVAGRVFVAGGDEEDSAGEERQRKVTGMVALLVLVVGGVGGVFWSGLIPGFDASLFDAQKGAAPVIARARTVAPDLVAATEESDIVALPKPSVDVQREVRFAALPQDGSGSDDDARDAVLRIIQQYTRSVSGAQADPLLSGGLGGLDQAGEEVVDPDVKTDSEIFSAALTKAETSENAFSAQKNRELQLALQTATQLDREISIVIKGQEAEKTEASDKSEEQQVAASPAAAPSPAASPADDSVAQVAQVQVEKSRIGSERKDLLARAVSNYRKGRLVEAEASYRRLLHGDPTNVDGLRGLAAVASATGRFQLAASTYLQILDYYPNDPIAFAELVNLQEAGDSILGEQAIKKLIGKQPESDHRLYFTLGNLYSEEGLWTNAQSAYFEAFSRDVDNPDYAFNLAVVLDYLGKPALALRYYGDALRLSEFRPSGFVISDAHARVRELSN